MADITKCNGNNCPMKETCYRYTAKITPQWQSYFSETPEIVDGKCDYYYKDETK
jgi:hypothetical protein